MKILKIVVSCNHSGILASRRVASIFTRTATLEKVVFVSETIEDVCRTSFFDFYSKLSLYG